MQNTKEKKSDRRVMRSQQALTDALLHLMLDKGYAETTVADIVEKANVGRSTFYAHFADKEDLLQQSLQGLKAFLTDETTIPPEREGPSHPALSFALPMLLHAFEQRELFNSLMSKRTGAPVQEHFQIMLTDLVLEKLGTAPSDVDCRIDDTMRAHFIVGAFLGTLLAWIADPGEQTPNTVDRKFRALILGGAFRSSGSGDSL
jgi:AcrR family transcriptional regulator